MTSRPWKILFAIIAVVYALYVVGIAVFLNTPLFARITEMPDTDRTHIRIFRAWSLVPGRIDAGEIRVLVREPDVELDIHLRGAKLKVDLAALRRKQVRIRSLRVDETTVAIRKKDPPEDPQKVGDVAEHARAALEEERRRLADRYTISVERVELTNLAWVKLEEKTLRGRMAISGGFMIQPGTQAEVYPSRFTIEDGDWNGELTAIRLASEVRIHRFRKARVNGSEVFRYFHAALDARAKASGMEVLNLTLRSLGDYGFGPGDADLAASVRVRAGRIEPGSFVRTEPSAIRLGGPRFSVEGRGHVEWEAGPSPYVSRLRLDLSRAKAEVRLGENRIAGSVGRVAANARIFGLDLDDLFTGLVARLRVEEGRLKSAPVGEPPATRARYRFDARVAGELVAIAGEPLPGEALPEPSSFTVDFDETELVLPKIGALNGRARLSLAVRPIDFRLGRVELPRARVDYRGWINGEYPVAVAAVSTEASRVFGAKTQADDRWQGRGRLLFEDFGGILSFLKDTDRISGFTAAGLHATKVRSALGWSITPRETRIEVKDLDSNGIWSGDGTLVTEKPADGGESETRGNFAGKVFGLPVGVGIADGDVKVKLLSGGKRPSETKRP